MFTLATIDEKNKRKMFDQEVSQALSPSRSSSNPPQFQLHSSTPEKIPSPHIQKRMQGDTRFKCDQQGHWSWFCPLNSPNNKPLSSSSHSPTHHSPQNIHCRCGYGFCIIKTSNSERNPDRKYYSCPIKRGAQCKGYGFMKWCDEPVDQSDLQPPLFKYPQCQCGAGVCRRVRGTEQSTIAVKYYFECPVRKGHGLCGYQVLEDEVLNNTSIAPVRQSMSEDLVLNNTSITPIRKSSALSLKQPWCPLQLKMETPHGEKNNVEKTESSNIVSPETQRTYSGQEQERLLKMILQLCEEMKNIPEIYNKINCMGESLKQIQDVVQAVLNVAHEVDTRVKHMMDSLGKMEDEVKLCKAAIPALSAPPSDLNATNSSKAVPTPQSKKRLRFRSPMTKGRMSREGVKLKEGHCIELDVTDDEDDEPSSEDEVPELKKKPEVSSWSTKHQKGLTTKYGTYNVSGTRSTMIANKKLSKQPKPVIPSPVGRKITQRRKHGIELDRRGGAARKGNKGKDVQPGEDSKDEPCTGEGRQVLRP